MNEKMRALVIRAPGDYAIEDVPRPEPDAGGLLLKVEACGLCGSDLRTLRSGHRKVTFPWTVGHEICGIVEETGPGYRGPYRSGTRLAVGPLAYCGHCDFCMDGAYELCENQEELGQKWPGGLADYVALPEDCVNLGNLQEVPQDFPAEYLAPAEPLSSCVNAQEKALVGLGDSVVILGSGPIGCIHAALARIRGATQVIMVDVVPERLEMAKPFGPDEIVNGTDGDPVETVRSLTGGKGARVVIAAAPAPSAAVQAVEMARKGGRVVQFGGLRAEDSRPGVDVNRIHYEGLHYIGTTTFAPRHNRTALDLIVSRRFPIADLVTSVRPLEDFAAGAERALAGKELKVVFKPGKES
jgi:L-iditol 2-dehydrogenase